ncbi:hypothetical protein GCM10018780_13200 [Streptomyces lanatus]|nr:hypothetical protein GCM10018780_13200 [Streptomyces lanatus]
MFVTASGSHENPAVPDQFTPFFLEWEPQVRRYLVWLEGDLSIIDDVAQETMISAYRYWERLSTLEQPRAWLFKVAGQRLADAQAARSRLGVLAEPPDVCASLTARDETATCDDRLHILEAVRRLPPQQAAAMALLIQYDLPFREIADVLGISVGAVKKHLHLARKRLKEWLDAEEGGFHGA